MKVKRTSYSTSKITKALAIVIAITGLFGYILTRKNLSLSFSLQAMGTLSAIAYCLVKDERELNPLSEAWKELEDERERINNQYLEDCRQFDETLEKLRQEHQEELNQQKEYSLEEQKKIIELFEGELELYTEQLQIKENLLRQAKLPKMAKGISRTETYANRIIGYLYSKNIEADYADSWEEYAYDLIRLIPKNASLSHFKALKDDLQLELRLSHPPQFEITQGCIQIKIDTRYFDTDKQSNKPLKMQLLKDEWLPEIAAKIIHGKVDGETQSGKSTFVSNLSALLSVAYPDAEFIKIDPKYPLSLDWDADLADWERKPKYPGIKTALGGLQELAQEVEHRLELVTEDVANGKKPRTFPKKLYLVDEIDWCVLEYGKPAIDYLQVGLKVGAALGVIVIYFGQTPRCSKLKMTKDDFRNSTNVSLGSNIPDAINTYVFNDAYGRELLDLYWRETNAGNIYICLVAQKGKKPFLAQLPAPNQYKPVSSKIQAGKNVKMSSSGVNLPQANKIPETVEPLSDKSLPVYEHRNLHPEYTPTEELSLWVKLQQCLETHGKTYTIENLLNCRGRDYKSGAAYLDYLSEKYG